MDKCPLTKSFLCKHFGYSFILWQNGLRSFPPSSLLTLPTQSKCLYLWSSNSFTPQLHRIFAKYAAMSWVYQKPPEPLALHPFLNLLPPSIKPPYLCLQTLHNKLYLLFTGPHSWLFCPSEYTLVCRTASSKDVFLRHMQFLHFTHSYQSYTTIMKTVPHFPFYSLWRPSEFNQI